MGVQLAPLARSRAFHARFDVEAQVVPLYVEEVMRLIQGNLAHKKQPTLQ